MRVFSLKVRIITESLDNHCGVVEVLQLEVLVLAQENCCCFFATLFLFQESSGLVRYCLIDLITSPCPCGLFSTTGIRAITIRHSDFSGIVQFLLML